MAAPLLLPLANQALKATEGDLYVRKTLHPAVTKAKRRRNPKTGKLEPTGEIVTLEPARESEVHVNAKGLLYGTGAALLGVVAAGIGWVAWNGVKVRNPLPVGDRTLEIVPGIKDHPPAWVERNRHAAALRHWKAQNRKDRAACERAGGTFEEQQFPAAGKCLLPIQHGP